MSGFPWLTVIGAVPLVGSVAVALTPDRRGALTGDVPPAELAEEGRGGARPLLTRPHGARDGALPKLVALGFSLVTLVLTIAMCVAFDQRKAGYQFEQKYSWIKAFGVHYAVAADGIALVLIALVAVLVPVVVLASWHEADAGRYGPKTYFALLLVLETMLVGVFAATDVFLFYVFFEAMLVPMYFLIGSYGGPQRSYAAVKFLLYSLFGGLLMLAAVIGLYVVASQQLGAGTFDFQTLSSQLHITHGVQALLFFGFFIAFAIKAPLVPFHTWLPDAGAEAPVGAAVLLVGVLDKVGTFGFLRYCIPLFPDASKRFAPIVLGLAVAGVLYGAIVAIGQRDLKRLVSYTSIAHFGFIAVGTFAFTTQGGTGAVLYMVNHGLSTGALFLVVGFLIARRRSRLIEDYGGVSGPAPLLAGVFLLAGLSSLALPGLNSFVSEFLVLVGTYTRYTTVAVLATLGIVLAALYILVMYQRTMHGPVVHEANATFADLTAREVWVVAPVLALVVALGVYPKPLLDTITPAVKATFAHTQSSDPAPRLPVAGAPGAGQ